MPARQTVFGSRKLAPRSRVRPRKRRFVKKLNKNKKRNVVVNYGPSLIPDTYLTKMSFTTEKIILDFDQRSLRFGSITFSGNSVFDPDQSSIVNGWPVGYAEMRHFYKKFYVSSSTIRIESMMTNGTVGDGARVFVLPTNTKDIGGIGYESLASNPYASKSKYFGSALGKPIVTTHHSMSTQSISGKKAPSIENDYSGNMRASGLVLDGNPVNQWFWLLCYESINETFTPNTITANIKITYQVKFYDRRLQIQDTDYTLTRPIGEVDDEIPEEDGPTGGGPP